MSTSVGPFVYENWKKKAEGAPVKGSYECYLFTDAHIVSEIKDGFGPYQILNTVSISRTDDLVPGMVLRVDEHRDYTADAITMKKTDTDRYHGGGLNDEFAALISLCLGIRVKAGGIIRSFEPDGDPKGRPEGIRMQDDPILIKRQEYFNPVLPQALGQHILDRAGKIETLVDLEPNTATALIKSARLYQDAVWLTESEPSLSWIMFVSAIEVAAGYWMSKSILDEDNLEYFMPDVSQLLFNAGGSSLVRVVSNRLSRIIGSQRKFIEFILNFLPEPPEIRPPEAWQHPWVSEVIESSLKIIYTWRSKALHGGIPFPEPMCWIPYHGKEGIAEIPIGLASATKGGVWLQKDAPMHLHIFEYIVRNSLCNWWDFSVHSKD